MDHHFKCNQALPILILVCLPILKLCPVHLMSDNQGPPHPNLMECMDLLAHPVLLLTVYILHQVTFLLQINQEGLHLLTCNLHHTCNLLHHQDLALFINSNRDHSQDLKAVHSQYRYHQDRHIPVFPEDILHILNNNHPIFTPNTLRIHIITIHNTLSIHLMQWADHRIHIFIQAIHLQDQGHLKDLDLVVQVMLHIIQQRQVHRQLMELIMKTQIHQIRTKMTEKIPRKMKIMKKMKIKIN